jgi:mono/diheme cytochrome c family protein
MPSSRIFRRPAALVALALAPAPLSAQDAKPDLDAFSTTVKPFLAAHCVRCHGEQKAQGKLTLHAVPGELAAGKAADVWQAVADRLKAGEMPPADEKQPDPKAIRAVTDWVDAELAKAGKTGAVAAGSLRTGNHVPHDLLFGPKAGAFALDNPPRVWRISPFIYSDAAKEFKNVTLAQPFTLPPGDGFKDKAAGGTVDESTTAQLMRNAEAIADEQLGLSTKKLGAKKPLKEFAPLLEAAPTRAQLDAALSHQFKLVLKREPKADERDRSAALYAAGVKAGGPEAGARAVLVAALLHPEATFRSEVGAGPAAAGRRLLAPREIAFALAYALSDKAPDAELLKAADGGRLKSPEDVAREAARLLARSPADNPRVMRFFREYFAYAGAPEVFKEQKDFPAHNARGLVEDTDRLILDVLAADKDVFAELLTTTKSYAHHKASDQNKKQLDDALSKFEEAKKKDPKKNPPNVEGKRLHLAYNLADFPAAQPVELPREQRAGVLTQPAWLVAHSENFDNHAIRRGKWVRERLLGGTVPDLPITVDAQLPDAPHKTLRERMAVTREAYCWQCHQKMNPLGLAFEQFDHFGRYRTTERVEVEGKKTDAKGKPLPPEYKQVAVDTTGVIDGTGDPAVDGPVASAVEMVRKLAKTDRARQVFVRHAFRFWTGRDENPGDARTLMAADAAYLKSGGSMKALIASLLTSESFLYRTVK